MLPPNLSVKRNRTGTVSGYKLVRIDALLFVHTLLISSVLLSAVADKVGFPEVFKFDSNEIRLKTSKSVCPSVQNFQQLPSNKVCTTLMVAGMRSSGSTALFLLLRKVAKRYRKQLHVKHTHDFRYHDPCFVYTLRDPRDVLCSTLKRLNGCTRCTPAEIDARFNVSNELTLAFKLNEKTNFYQMAVDNRIKGHVVPYAMLHPNCLHSMKSFVEFFFRDTDSR
mmetsp:Transcript_28055/g.44962  ORF Transcript_28055/g.44962 Transcript_28055/m.44962 type:complete len:223 (+) Transcript_28055:232-900(+)